MKSLKEKHNIPSGWVIKPLSKLCDNLDSKRVPITKSDRISGDVPYYGATGIIDYVNDYIFDEKILLIGEDGADWSSFANTAFVVSGKSWVNNHAHVLKCKNEDAVDYLEEYLNWQNLDKYTTGGTRKKLNKEALMSISVCLPEDKKEQQKIAEVLGTVDEDIAKTQEVIDATEKLKKGLMQQLFTRGIGHTKFKNTKLGEIPEEWINATMGDICKVRQGLQIPISKRFKETGKNRYLYITIQYLRDAHMPNIAEYIENPQSSVVCKTDDVLMTRTGNTGKVITGVEGVFHNNFFMVDYDREVINKSFLVYYLNSYSIQKMIKVRAGSTTIPDLNHGDFYSLPISVPKKPEQEKIAEILSAVDQKISVNKKLKAKLIQLKKGLMQDLLSGRVRVKI